MTLPWLRYDRAPVLAALALAARGREALPDALEHLASEDPLLRPWAKRLAPALRQGADLGALLKRWRLIDADTAARLTGPDQGAMLECLASEAADPVPGVLLARWFPVVAVLVIGFTPVVMLLLLQLIGINFEQMYKDLGIKLPGLTVLIFDLLHDYDWLWIPVIALGTAIGCHFNHRAGWGPLVPFPQTLIAHYWLLFVQLGHRDCQAPAASNLVRAAKGWFWLSLWRIPKRDRSAVAHGPLLSRLETLGCPGTMGWERHLALARLRCKFIAPELLWFALVALALLGVGLCAIALFLPLISVTEQLNSSGGFGVGSGSSSSLIDSTQHGIDLMWSWLGTWIPNLGAAPRLPRFNGGGHADLILIPLLIIAGLQLIAPFRTWIGRWIPWLKPQDGSTQIIQFALIAADEDRLPLNAVLEDLSVHLPRTLGRRLREALLAAHPEPLDTLADAGFIARSQVPMGWISRASGPGAWKAWVATLTDVHSLDLARLRTQAFLVATVVGLVGLFAVNKIVPSLYLISQEIGLPVSPLIDLFADYPLTMPLLVFLIWASITLLGALVSLMLQRRRRSILVGTIMLHALQRGDSEAAIAQLLAGILPRRAVALHAAGACGDLHGVMRICGWRVYATATLASHLAQATTFLNNAERLRLIGMHLLQTVCLGVPVLVITYEIFYWLTSVMKHLA
jgi:hypothetical protein